MAFWAFIQMRDHVLDFCASEPPAILSFSSADKDYDLISGSQYPIDQRLSHTCARGVRSFDCRR